MMKNIFAIIGVIIVGVALVLFIKLNPKQTSAPFEDITISPQVVDEGAGVMQGKLNINVICENALAVRTFPDGEAAVKFVEECKAGKYPEVIDEAKAQMNITDDRAI